MHVAYTLGRILLPIYFIVLGIQKLFGAEELAETLKGYVPLPVEIDAYLGGTPRYLALAYAVGAVQALSGVMVLVGLKARWAALILVVYVACTIFYVHNFWDMEAAVAGQHRMLALMNLSLLGGLLLVVAGGSGAAALDRRE
jgi:putative oxidoreductase